MNVNRVIIVGRLTSAAEIRTTQTGQNVCSFRLATNNFWVDKSGAKKEKTEFHNIVLWGRLADIAGEYLVKGQECFVEGRLETREYQKKDGTAGRSTDIIGEFMQLGARPNGGDTTSRDTAKPAVSKPTSDDGIQTIDL